ncbi:MAG TPA: cytochrome c3 family protein, partial [Candidatus Deferrimicrobiaceae bacterium]
ARLAPAENPHAGIACGECHATVPEKGKLSPNEVLATLRKDPIASCRECHEGAKVDHHPVVRRTGRALPEGLPLSASGEVICSTCHDIHMKVPVTYLLRGYDTGRYNVRMDMCLDCHGESFSLINPHQADPKGDKCLTCHPVRPAATPGAPPPRLRDDLERVCDFCHNVRSKAHPSNVDPRRKLPESLPRSAKGEVMCGSCHAPHGTEGTLHFLRPKYVEFLEAGRYQNPHGRNEYASCLGCHLTMSTKTDEMKRNMRYRGDDMLICLSCHGGMDACHPILIGLAPGMKPGAELALSADGKIKCVTCHDPTPSGGSGVAMRGRSATEPVNAICFRCHDKSDLTGRSPHRSMSDKTSCKFCHDTMTDPSNEEASRVSFISNTRLICLRCHPQTNHPAGADHMVAPRMTIPELFKLDDKGKLTCTSCHNPHIDVAEKDSSGGRKHRYAVNDDGRAFCARCHRR